MHQAGQLAGEKATAAHAGIHCEMHLDPLAGGGGQSVEVPRLFHGGKARRPTAGDDFLALGGPGGTEQVDRLFYARIADAAGLADVCHAEKRDVLPGQCPCHFFESVAVSTGLDYHHLFTAAGLARQSQVFLHGRQIDFRPSTRRRNGEGIVHGGKLHDGRSAGKITEMVSSVIPVSRQRPRVSG